MLRFWESKFPQLKPLKRGGGRRYYRPEDIALLRRIRQCLYQDGYTIRGVQKLLAATPAARQPAIDPDVDAEPVPARCRRRSGSGLGRARRAPPAAPCQAARGGRGGRPPSPDTKAALEEIRRELLEARALLDELMRRPFPELARTDEGLATRMRCAPRPAPV